MTVLKHQSHLLTGGGAGDTAPGLDIQAGATTPAAQQLLQVADFNGSPVWSCPRAKGGQSAVYGDHLRALVALGGVRISLDGIESPACVQFPDGNLGDDGPHWWGGSGPPSASTVGNAQIGDVYVSDTNTAGQRLYRCTVAGHPGTWVARGTI